MWSSCQSSCHTYYIGVRPKCLAAEVWSHQGSWPRGHANGSEVPHRCGRPAGTECSDGACQRARPVSPTGVPVPGGSAVRSGGRHEGTADSGGAAQEGASGACAAAEPGGVGSSGRKLGSGRSGCAACARSGVGQGGRCDGSSGHTHCRCRASGPHERVGAHGGLRPVRSARRTLDSGSGCRHHGRAHAAAAPNCSGSSFHTHCTHKACRLLPLRQQRA